MNTDSKKEQNEQCTIPAVWLNAFPNGKKKLQKGKYKYVYSYKLPNGDIVHQSFIPKYKWSTYHESEKKAAIEVDKFLIGKGKDPINVLVRK